VYFAQIGKKRNRYVKVMDAWDSCFEKVAARYRRTKFILKGADLYYGFDITDSQAFQQLVEAGVSEISILPTLMVPKDVSQASLALFEELKRNELMSHSSGICLPVPQVRSTVGLLVITAIQMGYKEIVLCGVDGKNRDHFFDQEKYMKEFPELIAVPESYTIEQHPHSVPEKTGRSSLDYIVDIAEFCEKSFGVQIKISSSDSYLSGKIPQYSFREEARSCSDSMV
jgi:hypothetical protein